MIERSWLVEAGSWSNVCQICTCAKICTRADQKCGRPVTPAPSAQNGSGTSSLLELVGEISRKYGNRDICSNVRFDVRIPFSIFPNVGTVFREG